MHRLLLMPDKPPQKPAKQKRPDDKQVEEGVREQAKTETEERPYLDTEGGE